MSWADYSNYLIADNVCEQALLIDTATGAVQASNLGIQQLPAYQMQIENEKAEQEVINVYEFNNLVEAINNNGVPPQTNKAGVRINNVKYYSTSYDSTKKTWYLKKSKGGACVCLTGANKLVLIGTWNETLKMANNVAQNPGECNKRVEALQTILTNAGF